MLKKPLLVVLLFHLLLYAVVILNVPIIRQIVVFIYLSFIPGFVLLKLLKLTETMLVEKILFMVGLSLAFLMFVGLLINQLFLALGAITFCNFSSFNIMVRRVGIEPSLERSFHPQTLFFSCRQI
jgi:uncharacterized membrane protein